MRRILSAAFALAFTAPAAAEVPGLVSLPSSHDVPTTVERFVTAADEKGLKVFTRVDHAEAARKAGLELAPTELVLFGNPKLGTQLMLCAQSVAIDLPLKVLVYQDADGQVHLAYNDPSWLAARHQMSGCEEPIQMMTKAVSGLAQSATR